jgi:hypothetical protein
MPNGNPALDDPVHVEDGANDGSLFQHADMFERDCVEVAHRVSVMQSAYNTVRDRQPAFAAVALETIARDMQGMQSMARTVGHARSANDDDLELTDAELWIALEWLLVQRHLTTRYRRAFEAALTGAGLAEAETSERAKAIEREATAYGHEQGALEKLHSEVILEFERRNPADEAAA